MTTATITSCNCDNPAVPPLCYQCRVKLLEAAPDDSDRRDNDSCRCPRKPGIFEGPLCGRCLDKRCGLA